MTKKRAVTTTDGRIIILTDANTLRLCAAMWSNIGSNSYSPYRIIKSDAIKAIGISPRSVDNLCFCCAQVSHACRGNVACNECLLDDLWQGQNDCEYFDYRAPCTVNGPYKEFINGNTKAAAEIVEACKRKLRAMHVKMEMVLTKTP